MQCCAGQNSGINRTLARTRAASPRGHRYQVARTAPIARNNMKSDRPGKLDPNKCPPVPEHLKAAIGEIEECASCRTSCFAAASAEASKQSKLTGKVLAYIVVGVLPVADIRDVHSGRPSTSHAVCSSAYTPIASQHPCPAQQTLCSFICCMILLHCPSRRSASQHRLH